VADGGDRPGGASITVPLQRRDQEDLAVGAGDAAQPASAEAAGGAPERQEVETAALAPETSEPAPAVRVIERPLGSAPPAVEPASGPTDPAAQAVAVPSFDVVRVDPDGRTVMAGRAAPLTDVEIRSGGEVIDRVTTTATGEWVSIPSAPLAAGDQELSLTALPEHGRPTESRQVVVVSVPEPVAKPDLDQPVAVVVDKDEGGKGRILQAPDRLQSPGDERLALKLVDYDDRGAIRLSGEAPPGVPVRIYVDNVPSALVIGDSKGYWITTLDQDLPGGDYTLRLDQLDHKGQTVARLETPFTRVATPPVEGEAKVDYVVVQPGNSLWRIARRLSGDGFNYVYIFEANRAQIRDPDIIYPGQVFEVPPGPG
jgi:nucleoid-associated protein YgaU